jgi:CdiI immunity protein
MTHQRENKDAISAGQFPALRNFLRGYFHQDMKDEYGSAADATRAFCKDAGTADLAALSAEWSRFVQQTNGMPLDQINQILTGPLGSSYALHAADLKAISAILQSGKA